MKIFRILIILTLNISIFTLNNQLSKEESQVFNKILENKQQKPIFRSKKFLHIFNDIPYQYNAQKKIEIAIEEVPLSWYVNITNLRFTFAIIEHFYNTKQLHRIYTLLNSIIRLPCLQNQKNLIQTSFAANCFTSKKKALNQLKRLKKKYPYKIDFLAKKLPFVFYSLSMNEKNIFFFEDTYFKIIIKNKEPILKIQWSTFNTKTYRYQLFFKNNSMKLFLKNFERYRAATIKTELMHWQKSIGILKNTKILHFKEENQMANFTFQSIKNRQIVYGLFYKQQQKHMIISSLNPIEEGLCFSCVN